MDPKTTATGLTAEARTFLKALASETRQEILFLFSGGGELTVGEVAERLSLAQSAASTHLAMLRDGGLLTSRKEWKTVYYRADATRISHALAELQQHLMSCCPPEQHAEGGCC
jgi:DNA-binding transcriptional ArsR family regulator